MKKQKMTNFDEDEIQPGTQWDVNNYSCAYDALFTICITYGQQNQKKMEKKKISRVQSISFYTA